MALNLNTTNQSDAYEKSGQWTWQKKICDSAGARKLETHSNVPDWYMYHAITLAG